MTAPDNAITTYVLTGSTTSSTTLYTLDGIAFQTAGTYDVAVYATDDSDNTSLPITTTVTVEESGFALDLIADRSSYSAGDTLTLSTEAIIDELRDYTGTTDLYWTVTLPDGNTYYITDLELNISITPTPIAAGWPPSSIPLVQLLALPLPEGLPTGDYAWKLTFTETGRPYTDPGGWLAQGRAVHGFE